MRALLKISGEAFKGGQSFGIEGQALNEISEQIAEIASEGIEVAVVVGGGNIFRGAETQEIDRVVGDYIGMLATVINGMALQDALERRGFETRLQSAIEMHEICEPVILRRAIRHLEKGRIVIFAAGTGNPYFTTDTAAALRASEIEADLLLKATKVDGVYSSDPRVDKEAKHLKRITYRELITRDLKIMDLSAVDMCRENNIPIVVFDIFTHGNLKRAVAGEDVGTLVVPS
ncbi:MAG: UMP kinase [Candidatus Bipolaricaulia bacterium]